MEIKLLLEELFALDLEKSPEENLEELAGDLAAAKEFKLEVSQAESIIELDYQIEDDAKEAMALAVAAGLPINIFANAEAEYRKIIEEYGRDYEYELEGCFVAASLAQYAAVVCSDFIADYQLLTYNAFGLGNLLEFRGNEFLGLDLGLLFFL